MGKNEAQEHGKAGSTGTQEKTHETGRRKYGNAHEHKEKEHKSSGRKTKGIENI